MLSFAPEIRQTFELFDSDHDGKVSTKEISVIMRSLGMLISDKEMDELVARLDTDGEWNQTENITFEYQTNFYQHNIKLKVKDVGPSRKTTRRSNDTVLYCVGNIHAHVKPLDNIGSVIKYS